MKTKIYNYIICLLIISCHDVKNPQDICAYELKKKPQNEIWSCCKENLCNGKCSSSGICDNHCGDGKVNCIEIGCVSSKTCANANFQDKITRLYDGLKTTCNEKKCEGWCDYDGTTPVCRCYGKIDCKNACCPHLEICTLAPYCIGNQPRLPSR